jgi:Bacterial PH domain
MSSEIEVESIPGLPHDLPPGERVIWQGKPQWKGLARQTFKIGWLAAYFVVFASARLVVAIQQQEGVAGALGVGLVLVLAGACLGVLALLAWLYARTSIYTLTTRRIVLRTGVALPMTWNLPFSRLAAADVKLRSAGDGDIVLQLKSPDRIAWLQLWPHTAPWQFVAARPALRTILEPARVAVLVADAVAAWAAKESVPVLVADQVADGAATLQRAAFSPMSQRIATEAGQ